MNVLHITDFPKPGDSVYLGSGEKARIQTVAHNWEKIVLKTREGKHIEAAWDWINAYRVVKSPKSSDTIVFSHAHT